MKVKKTKFKKLMGVCPICGTPTNKKPMSGSLSKDRKSIALTYSCSKLDCGSTWDEVYSGVNHRKKNIIDGSRPTQPDLTKMSEEFKVIVVDKED